MAAETINTVHRVTNCDSLPGTAPRINEWRVALDTVGGFQLRNCCGTARINLTKSYRLGRYDHYAVDSNTLPPPKGIPPDIVDDPQAALSEFAAVAEALEAAKAARQEGTA
jgi:hypothetical protein